MSFGNAQRACAFRFVGKVRREVCTKSSGLYYLVKALDRQGSFGGFFLKA